MQKKRIVIELENFNEKEHKRIEKLFSRVGNILTPEESIQQQGKLQMNPMQRSVLLEGKEISLTAKEFDILFYLASHPGIVFTHRQIYEAVWKKESFCDEGNITAHIGRIRKKIEPDPKEPVYIQTVRGVGYRFAKQKDRQLR